MGKKKHRKKWKLRLRGRRPSPIADAEQSVPPAAPSLAEPEVASTHAPSPPAPTSPKVVRAPVTPAQPSTSSFEPLVSDYTLYRNGWLRSDIENVLGAHDLYRAADVTYPAERLLPLHEPRHDSVRALLEVMDGQVQGCRQDALRRRFNLNNGGLSKRPWPNLFYARSVNLSPDFGASQWVLVVQAPRLSPGDMVLSLRNDGGSIACVTEVLGTKGDFAVARGKTVPRGRLSGEMYRSIPASLTGTMKPVPAKERALPSWAPAPLDAPSPDERLGDRYSLDEGERQALLHGDSLPDSAVLISASTLFAHGWRAYEVEARLGEPDAREPSGEGLWYATRVIVAATEDPVFAMNLAERETKRLDKDQS